LCKNGDDWKSCIENNFDPNRPNDLPCKDAEWDRIGDAADNDMYRVGVPRFPVDPPHIPCCNLDDAGTDCSGDCKRPAVIPPDRPWCKGRRNDKGPSPPLEEWDEMSELEFDALSSHQNGTYDVAWTNEMFMHVNEDAPIDGSHGPTMP